MVMLFISGDLIKFLPSGLFPDILIVWAIIISVLFLMYWSLFKLELDISSKHLGVYISIVIWGGALVILMAPIVVAGFSDGAFGQ